MEFSFLIEKGKTKSILNLKFCLDCPLFISLCLSTLCFNPLSSSKYWFSLLLIICINQCRMMNFRTLNTHQHENLVKLSKVTTTANEKIPLVTWCHYTLRNTRYIGAKIIEFSQIIKASLTLIELGGKVARKYNGNVYVSGYQFPR